jgi:FAD/FMN-containing dehydrogenase
MTHVQLQGLAGGVVEVAQEAIDQFRLKLKGELLDASSSNYDEVRSIWNAMHNHKPALLARCTGVADVMAVVEFARTHQLLLAVRGGGHNAAGHAICEGGLVLDLSLMRGVWVDPAAKIARAQGGATWGDLDRETQQFGLATPGGVVSTTGIGGLTLGGGIGWIRRAHGLSCDNLRSVDVVTADGRFLKASESENADLFWALHGGGGNFGVVTSFEFDLHPVGPEVMFCGVMYAAEHAEKVLQFWRTTTKNAPDELSSQSFFWSVPPVDFVPKELWHQPLVGIIALFLGDPQEGERMIQPLREIATPVIDLSGIRPYAEVQQAFDAFFPKGRFYYYKSSDLGSMSDEVIQAMLTPCIERPTHSSVVTIWHYGGAISRVAPDATPFGSRNAPYLFSVDTVWDDPNDQDRSIAWARDLLTTMKPHSTGGMYINFPGMGEEGEALTASAYGQNYQRLQEVKKKYDPGNLFRCNQNISPKDS